MDDRLAEIRARLDAATPGQWSNDNEWSEIEAVVVPQSAYMEPYLMSVATVGNPPNADLIAHAPADIAWLLDEVERLRQEIDRLRYEVMRRATVADKYPAQVVRVEIGDDDA